MSCGGGLPLTDDSGRATCAVGVLGGTVDQDGEVASACTQAL